MVILRNIVLGDNRITADYFPEGGELSGKVSVSTDTAEASCTLADGYEKIYHTMAISGLKKILERRESDPDFRIPNEWTVMWY